MQIKEYQEHSTHQFSAHDGCADMLTSCIERLAKRIDFQDSHNPGKRWQIADLGSADGTNTVRTLQSAIHHLRTCRGGEITPLSVTFEEHPSSDKDALNQVLNGCNDWFVQNDITRSILMKSFYEPLFEPESLDMMLSYICLHWLDTTHAPDGVADWKFLHTDSAELCNFTFINETTAPKSLAELWRRKLGKRPPCKVLCPSSEGAATGSRGSCCNGRTSAPIRGPPGRQGIAHDAGHAAVR
jgi:hypothetical protein